MHTLRLSRLHNVPVLDAFHAMQAGAVSSVVVDTRAGQVVAIDVGHGDGVLVSRVPLEQLERVGAHRVLVPDAAFIPFIEPEAWGPHCVGTDRLIGLEVLNEAGERIGYIADVHVDPSTLRVQHYDLAAPLWQSVMHPNRLWPSEIVACSQDVMIADRGVPEAAEPKPPLPFHLPTGRGLRKVA